MKMNHFVLIAIAQVFSLNCFAAEIPHVLSEDQDSKVVESNYIVNPKGCMGLGDTPEKDGLVVVLTYDKLGTVTPDGRVQVPEKFAYVAVLCSTKAKLESCKSKRAIFQIEDSSGPFGFPQSKEFSCKTPGM